MDLKDKTWPTVHALSIACAIHREKGFTSVASYTFNDPSNDSRWTNKDIMSYTLVPEIASKDFKVMIKVKPCDLEKAQAIIKYYRRLSFGVLGENINDYLERVFLATQKDDITFADCGILASVPNMYDKDVLEAETLDQIKATLPEHYGTVGEAVTFNVMVIKAKYITQIDCWGHEAITSTNHFISFLSKTKLLERGATARIKGKIKKHTQHYKSNLPETQLNYVKVVDGDYVWQ